MAPNPTSEPGAERITELERRAAAAEQRFQLAMEHAPAGMALTDLDGRLLAVNRALCELLGRSEAELLTLTSLDVTHPDDVELDLSYGERVIAGERLRPIEKRYVRPDGSVVWGLLSASVIHDSHGAPQQLLGQVVDVTDRHAARQVHAHSRWLERIAGELGRIGGWSIEVPSDEMVWSPQIFDLVDHEGNHPPQLDAAIELLEPRGRAAFVDAVERCATDGTPFDLETSMHSFAGRPMHGRLIGEPERDDDGRIVRIVGAFQDITEQHEAAEQAHRLAQRLTTTLESITDAVYTVDRDWRFTFLNTRAEQLLRRTREDLVGKNLWEQFPEALETELYATYTHAMNDQVADSLDALYYPPLDTWFEVHAYPSEQGLAVYFRDVSDRVARQRSQQLVLTAEREASERLRQLGRMKNAFLTAVSHELRTPLAVVQGNASTLQRLRGNLPDATREQLEDALANHAERLDRLLADLLDIDRLTHASSEQLDEEFDVVALTRGVVDQSPERDRIHVQAPDRLPVVADPVQIERIVANLVGNAVKYAESGPVLVRLDANGRGGLRLEVHDRGPGIPDEHLERVFEPFHRVDSTEPKPGTGIGLALVAEFTAMHKGRAWAERHDGEGAHVYVEIPPATARHSAAFDATG